MKILTLNTHSLIESLYEAKLTAFVEAVVKEQPDIIGLQEVNQTSCASPLEGEELPGYVPARGVRACVRRDNHAARVAERLRERGIIYHWTWVPAKLGYDIYDEGLALLSRTPILDTDQFTISHSQDYHNWKTRKILGIQTGGSQGVWFYTVHMGWWDDREEPFREQWNRIEEALAEKKMAGRQGGLWLMGDFNSPAGLPDQGYDLVRTSGWNDTYLLAGQKDLGYTVEEVIDGWRDKGVSGMRIDYIWSYWYTQVKTSRVVFDGKTYPRVSDHNGILIEL